MQNRDRFNVIELMMQGLSGAALVLMITVLAVYFARAVVRLPGLHDERRTEELRRDVREADERRWLVGLEEEAPVGALGILPPTGDAGFVTSPAPSEVHPQQP